MSSRKRSRPSSFNDNLPSPKRQKLPANRPSDSTLAVSTTEPGHQYPSRRRRRRRGKKPKRVIRKKVRTASNSSVLDSVIDGYAPLGVSSPKSYQQGLRGLTSLNNFAKALLISKYSKPKMDVLDLCCGKGGDLHKWARGNIRSYVGVDVVLPLVQCAVDRYNTSDLVNYQAQFVVADLSSLRISTSPLISSRIFDLVSCQFSIHYFFESENTVRTFLANVVDGLRHGGHFLCITVDGDVVRDRFESLGTPSCEGGIQVTNGVFKMRFAACVNWDQSLGIKYTFSLPGSVVDVPEFVVFPRVFKQFAGEFGLECCFEENLVSFVRNNLENPENQQMIKGMFRLGDRPGRFPVQPVLLRNLDSFLLKRPDDSSRCVARPAELQTCNLYRVYVFRKVSGEGPPALNPAELELREQPTVEAIDRGEIVQLFQRRSQE